MDGAPSFTKFFFFFSFVVAQAAFDTVIRETLPSPASLIPSPPSPSQNPNDDDDGGRGTPFKPSVIVIVGVLTTLFSITFLLLLYVRHCKPGNENLGNSNRGRGGGHGPLVRKNSGIDRVVIESLPIFRFGSLRGEKDGLECAVCLTPFEPVEVLRLLPKCRHAFHVECVDTWLDAHSTCPLCRHRVDPEDILLLEEVKVWPQNQPIPENKTELLSDLEIGSNPDPPGVVPGQVSARPSSVEERGGFFLPIIMQEKGSSERRPTTTLTTTSTSSTPLKKSMIPFRRSLDSAMFSGKIKRKEREGSSISYGGDGGGARKDGLLLLTTEKEKENKHRLSHQIIVSPSPKHKPVNQRWSDVQPSDLLYLTSEMILMSEDNNSRRLSSSSSSRPSLSQQQQNMQLPLYRSTVRENANRRGRMSLRSVSEITGLSRNEEQGEQEGGVASRWRAWISQTQRNVR